MTDMINKTRYTICAVLALLSASCSEDVTESFSDKARIPIGLSATYPVTSATRATDNGFVADDVVGVFIVDYNTDGTPGEPAVQGNRGSNVRFTFDGGAWSAPYQLYWADKSTPADFYGYYPFDEAMSSVTEYAFNVSRQQNSSASSTAASGYEKSDFLWAKSTKIMPTEETVDMQYKHLMSGITVMLEKGAGFTDAEWAEYDKTVLVENTVLGGSINITTGETTVGSGKAEPITPLEYNGTWRAVTYPQTVEAGKSVISVTVDGQTYNLKKAAAMTYLSGKMHNFTVTVDKSASSGAFTFTLKSEDIVAWIDDPELHDGLVRQYTIVKVEQAGTFQQTIKNMGVDHERVKSLKVEGQINNDDLYFIGQNMNSIQSINLLKAIIEDGNIAWFGGHSALQHVVFPEKGLTSISGQAFANSGLSGSLIIPEGVVTIGGEAFGGCNFLKGTLTLPSTLKRIEGGAFAFTALRGELRLPEGIEYIDPGYYYVFQECDFEGSLYLPESLTTLPNLGFSKMTGEIVIPRNISVIGENVFGGIGCSGVKFHDGITRIESGAFCNSQLSGELVLPPNLKSIGGQAFAGTKITKIIFPDELRVMDDGAYNTSGIFGGCTYLMGTLEFAKNVSRVPKGCFISCNAMTGLILSKNVETIDELAFAYCSSLNSIVCENPEPPVVCTDAFYGVPKDNFTVEVPKGSVEKYKNARGWSDFKRIAEYSNFVCRPAQANALNTAHNETLILNADGDWAVEHCPSWCTLSKTSGTGKTELQLTINQMAHGNGNRRDSILFRMPQENYTTYCVVSQYDYEHEEDSYATLQTHTKGRGIDILFLGDGYDGEAISDGSYLNLVNEQMEYFFGLEPYKSHRDYFNVYVAFPLSQEKGVNTMNTYVNNHFGTLYGYDGTMGTSDQLITETDDIYDYAVAYTPLASSVKDRSLVVLVPNSTAYSGNTVYGRDGMAISICPPSERPYPQDTRGVIQHEAGGHGFGKLGDEEIKYSAWAPASVLNDIEDKHNGGWYQNLATTSKMSSVPWADFIFDTRYSDNVDIYEGGAEYMRGVFRPEANSCMNYGIPYYNAVSRLSIMRRIFDYAGEEFTMDYFYSHDSKEWGETETATRGTILQGSSYGSSNLHRTPKTVDFKQMGNSVRKIRAALKAKQDKQRTR